MPSIGERDDNSPVGVPLGLGLELEAVRDQVNAALGSLVVCIACVAEHSNRAEKDAIEGARIAVRQIADAMALLRTIAASTRLIEQRSGVFKCAAPAPTASEVVALRAEASEP